MNDHLRGIALGVGAWAFFLVAGLPDYYRQYPAAIMLAAVALSIVPFAIAMRMMVRIMRRGSPRRRAARLAFYLTVPPMILDHLYCGLYLGQGWSFYRPYWYLCVYWVLPWLVLVGPWPPAVGRIRRARAPA